MFKRIFVMTALSVAAIGWCSATKASQQAIDSNNPSTTKKQFKDEWPADRPMTAFVGFREPWGPGTHAKEEPLVGLIHRYFEPKDLTDGVVIKFTLLNQAGKSICKLVSNTGSDADLFYCEAAIWEAKLYSDHPPRLVASPCDFSSKSTDSDSPFSCSNLYLEQHPEQAGKVVVVHIIPVCTGDLLAKAIEPSELHSIRNLRAIKISNVRSSLLQEFREDWQKYLSGHVSKMGVANIEITRADLLDYANNMVEKYKSLFVSE